MHDQDPIFNQLAERDHERICFHQDPETGLKYVVGGRFDDTSWIKPCAHIWTRSAQPWISFPSDVLTYRTQPEDFSELLGLWK